MRAFITLLVQNIKISGCYHIYIPINGDWAVDSHRHSQKRKGDQPMINDLWFQAGTVMLPLVNENYYTTLLLLVKN